MGFIIFNTLGGMDEQQALSFLEKFSLLTVGESESGKKPNFSWSKNQNEKLAKEEFLKRLNYQGGIIKKDGTELPKTIAIGIITGFDFLECVDVDTKVLSTQIEKDQFWNEYYQTLKDNIIDFEKKFAIYTTASGGFHILYKSKRVVGNEKIAKLKGHKEAILESRGIGGYIFIYPKNKYAGLTYFQIDFISDADRETLWRISKAYNFIDEKPIEPKRDPKIYATDEITPWQDFNDKTDIWSVIQDDFFIPSNGQKSKHYLVKRHGATSDHSGYVFRDSGCMFLFSTGTIYPNEKLISPFVAYAYKYHNADFKEATKDLYDQGFGSRLKKKIEENKPKIDKPLPIENVTFPLDIFPKEIQHYILECHNKLDSNIDFMGCSLLWLISTCIGNCAEVEVKRGWIENGVVWLAVVGKAGIGKTPSINNIIFPLSKLNFNEIKKYREAKERYDYIDSLNKKERADLGLELPPPPKKSQFLVNDITLEALVDLHQENDNSVGVFKDELAGWFKDMNKYRSGSDLEFWLSCWSGKSVYLNRITRAGSFIEKPFIPVLGGIQPSIFNQFATDENKDNGFLDRMLLSFPDAKVDEYNENEVDYSVLQWYSDTIVRFYQGIKQKLIKRNNDNDIEPMRVRFDDGAKTEWKRIFNRITKEQNSEEENEYLKSMFPKQKSYIPRFALLIHFFESNFDENVNYLWINKESMLKAEKLSNYFVMNAKKIKIEATEIKDLKTASKGAETTFDKLQAIYKADNDFNRTKVAELLGVSRRQIINLIKKIEEK
jgi:hypothetical protein